MTALISPFKLGLTIRAARDLAGVLGVLASPQRLRIVSLLAEHGELTIKDLTSQLSITQPTVSHHVAQLISMGLVAQRRDGVWGFCRLRLAAFAELAAALTPKGGES